jgi:hypothetical protein
VMMAQSENLVIARARRLRPKQSPIGQKEIASPQTTAARYDGTSE